MINKLLYINKISKQLLSNLESCQICPHNCKVNRKLDKKGFCKLGYLPKIYSYNSHFGEEPVISGTKGSGVIFFSSCNLHCVYCQNYKFSQFDNGTEVSFEKLAEIMLSLQEQGCHNINLVTPTCQIFQIIKSLELAIKQGLKIPIIYNTNGYDKVETLKLLNGIIDIYLPDIKYYYSYHSKKYSGVKDYFKIAGLSIKEMYNQVKECEINENDIIKKGLIIRHLVLPNNISDTDKILKFIKNKISINVPISLMGQYYPCYKSDKYSLISRKLKKQEYSLAYDMLLKYGFTNGWIQEEFLKDDQQKFLGENM